MIEADHWCWKNLTDTAVLSVVAGGTAGEMGLANLTDPRVGKAFRSASMPMEIRLVLAAAAPISVIGLFGINLPDLGDLTVKFGTSPGADDLLSLSIPTGGDTESQHVTLLRDDTGALAPVEGVQHVAIACTGTVGLQVGRIWLGSPDFTPQIGHSPTGSSWGALDLSIRSATPRQGAVLIDRGRSLRTFTASYQMLDAPEWRDILFDFDRLYGLKAQVLFIPNVDVYPLPLWPILGYLRELPENQFVRQLTAQRVMSIVEAG